MPNSRHLEILRGGVEVWNTWRSEHDKIIPDLSGANLQGLCLNGADLSDARMIGTVLKGATLHNVNFSRAYLHGADFHRATLCFSKFVRAFFGAACFANADLSYTTIFKGDIGGANLTQAWLYGSVFRDCDLTEVNFRRAILAGTIFANVDLSGAKALNQIKFEGPFTIGVDTLVRSEGRIPARFLRAAGFPKIFQEAASTYAAGPFQFHSCFISYSTKDQQLTDCLFEDLWRQGVRCAYAPEDFDIGERFRRRIDERIRKHDKLLLVLSRHSVESEWVGKEVETAMEIEREKRREIILPIRLDDSVMEIKTGWPADIRRSRHIGDFQHWKNRAGYQKAFLRLLRALRKIKEGPQS